MYSPKISEELVPTLYKISQARKIHMTRIVNEVIRSYLTGIDVEDLLREKTASEPPVQTFISCPKRKDHQIPIQAAREKVFKPRSRICKQCKRCQL